MRRNRKIGEIMVAEGYIDEQQLATALERQQEGDHNLLGLTLVKLGYTGATAVTSSLAIQHGVPYVDPTEARVDPSLVWMVPRDMAEKHQVIPLERISPQVVRVAMANPRNIDAVRDLEFLFRATIAPAIATPSRIQEAIQRHYNMEQIAQQMLAGIDQDMRAPTTSPTGLELDSAKITAQLKKGGTTGYINLLNFLLVNAIERNASDIHLEPQHDDMRVRYRIDGLLRDVLTLPNWAERPLVSRIKVVGQLDLAGTRPQDGKVTANLGDRRVDMRIAVIPSQFGEKVVIRLLDPALLQTDLSELGWQPRALSAYYRMVSQPQGLVLCVGPTGSGKSTTLYATIHRLRNETTSIITVEDPIEYSLPGISQIQVNVRGGMSFDTVVRSLLRQDPNVIVIGEIRDSKTADVALEAANTGHMVLSTVHSNNSISTITRLLDLGVPPYLLGATLNGVVAQRLVRKVCQECSILIDPEMEDFSRLGIDPATLPGKIRRAGSGCPVCRYVGYKGRVGVIEVLAVTDAIRQMILEGATEEKLWRQAREDAMLALFDDGLAKVAQGVTTLEEIIRVVPMNPWRDEQEERPSIPSLEEAELDDIEPTKTEELEALSDAFLEPFDDASDVVMPAALQEPAGPPTILVADDAEEVLRLVALTLEDEFKVELARDGIEVLDAVAKSPPDMLILDVMMPRMSGFDACERIKEDPATADIPVLFLSARGERPQVKRGFHVGADDYLAKPFDPEELLLRVRALIRRSRRARARA